MPRPATKQELLDAMQSERQQLTTVLRQLGPHGQSSPFGFAHRDRCVRDVLGHLAAWEQLFLSWYRQGMAGGNPQMPAAGYTWKTTPALNARILADCQTVTLARTRRRLTDRHRRIREIVRLHSDEELFTKRQYHWTGSTSLGSYIISATSAHDRWAVRLLQRHLQDLQQT